MNTVEMLNMGIEHIDPDHDLTDRDKLFVEQAAKAVKKCVDENQYLDDWKIGKAVFLEFKGVFDMLDEELRDR